MFCITVLFQKDGSKFRRKVCSKSPVLQVRSESMPALRSDRGRTSKNWSCLVTCLKVVVVVVVAVFFFVFVVVVLMLCYFSFSTPWLIWCLCDMCQGVAIDLTAGGHSKIAQQPCHTLV